MISHPKYDALIEVLYLYQPEKLKTWHQEHPQEFAKEVQTVGETDAIAVAELAIIALSTTKTRIDICLTWLRRRLKSSMKLRLIGNLVSAVTSVGLISAVLMESRNAAIATAVINFISSVSLVISQYLESPLFAKNNNPQELFDQLIQSVSEAENLQFKLTVAIKMGATNAELLELSEKANNLVASVRKIEAIIGVPVAKTAS
ncbi:hypothetical protein [Calothrix sp. 336/3]|uniref:hypothetical protein n=1 Tax=Calothrix sp. 336/3 TaxID=1337936 RepID=UPI0004E45514|nr:hypothetical protein [Calothrix sp. 336/3]AKG23014.1 hypothetical protein IJ00_18580 [Calothrix sp. 336/3]